jgi:C4-dicarboxylate transporter DctQ subunit
MISRIDDVIARIERVLLLGALAMMTILVGLDVAQRTFSRPVGRTEQLFAVIVNAVAGPLDAAGRASAYTAGSAFFVVFFLVGFVLASHSARSMAAERIGAPAPAWGASIGIGVGAFVGVAVFIKILLLVFPSSVPGAQKFALGFMLWSGMLGASLATKQRRHIMLDPIIKKLEGKTRNRFGLISGLVSAAFCALIATLGVLQISGEIHEWSTGEGVGVYPSLPIPMWIATLAIPLSFAVMAFRFARGAALDLIHGPPAQGDTHGVDLEEVKRLAESNEANA